MDYVYIIEDKGIMFIILWFFFLVFKMFSINGEEGLDLGKLG